MRPLEWTFIQYNWCLFKKRRLRHLHRERTLWSYREMAFCAARTEALEETNLANPDLGLLVCRSGRKQFCSLVCSTLFWQPEQTKTQPWPALQGCWGIISSLASYLATGCSSFSAFALLMALSGPYLISPTQPPCFRGKEIVEGESVIVQGQAEGRSGAWQSHSWPAKP